MIKTNFLFFLWKCMSIDIRWISKVMNMKWKEQIMDLTELKSMYKKNIICVPKCKRTLLLNNAIEYCQSANKF